MRNMTLMAFIKRIKEAGVNPRRDIVLKTHRDTYAIEDTLENGTIKVRDIKGRNTGSFFIHGFDWGIISVAPVPSLSKVIVRIE